MSTLKTGRGYMASQVEDFFTLSLSDVHPPKVEIREFATLHGEYRVELEVGHALVVMTLAAAEEICTALRFHQMGEREEAKA